MPGEVLRGLTWLGAQARHWYLRVMPAILATWVPGRDLEREDGRTQSVRHPAEYFSEIRAIPRGSDVIEYQVRLAVDFEHLVFVAIGPDRGRVQLAARAEGPWDHALEIDRASVSLKPGESVSLFARFRP